MNPEIKQKWIDALRSGYYNQTTGALARTDPLEHTGKRGYCCLGVLCEIAVEDNIVNTTTGQYAKIFASVKDPLDYESAVLPKAVSNWSELFDINPEFKIGSTDDVDDLVESFESFVNYDNAFYEKGDEWWSSLASLNDSGASFGDIANVIERYL